MRWCSFVAVMGLLWGGAWLPTITAAAADDEVDAVVTLLDFVIEVDQETAAKCLATLRAAIQSGELGEPRLTSVRRQLGEKFGAILAAGPEQPLFLDVALVAGSWGDQRASRELEKILATPTGDEENRLAALDALAAARHTRLLTLVGKLVTDPATSPRLVSRVLAALAHFESPRVADLVLQVYPRLAPDLQPKAIELLTQRAEWSKPLIHAIGAGTLAPSVLNANQVARLQVSRDAELVELVRTRWGTVRTERNPQRLQVIEEMRERLTTSTGSAVRGRTVFQKVCGQCHKIYGQGQEVGPDITRNGRASFDQLLSNVFDPSLVIGASYQARTVITTTGRVVTGLVAEDNRQRMVLKIQGGKQEVIPRGQIDEVIVSKLSLMPEDLEKQLQPQELVDLFQFLMLDRDPDDPDARLIPGAPAGR